MALSQTSPAVKSKGALSFVATGLKAFWSFWTGTLWRRIGLAIFLCVSVSIIFSVVAAAWSAQARSRDHLGFELSDHTRMLSDQVKQRLARGLQITDELATLIEEGAATGADRADIDRHIRAIAQREERVFGIWFVSAAESFDGRDAEYRGVAPSDSTGSFVPYWRRTAQGGLVQDTTGAEPTTLEDRGEEYYTLPVELRQPVLIEPYTDEMEGRPGEAILMTTLARPVVAGDRVLGVVGVDLSLEDLNAFLARSDARAEELRLFAALLSPAGAVIGDSARVSGNGADVEALRAVADGSLEAPVRQHLWGGTSLVRSVPIQIDGVEGEWRLVVATPMAPVAAAAGAAALRTALLGCVALCFAALIALYVSKRLAAPIIAAQRVMEKLANGEDDAERIAPTGIAEIDKMTATLSVFADALVERNKWQIEADARAEENERLLAELKQADATLLGAQRQAITQVSDLMVRLAREENASDSLDLHGALSGVPEVDTMLDALMTFAAAIDRRRFIQQEMEEELAEKARLLEELQDAHAAIVRGQQVVADALGDAFDKLEQGIALTPEHASVGVPQVDGILEMLQKFAALVEERRQLQHSLLSQTDEMNTRLFELEQAYVEAGEGQKLVVDEMRQAMRKVHEGDLAYRIDTFFPHEHRGLRMDFNDTSASLQKVMLEILESALRINRHSREVSDAATALAEKTDQAKYGLSITGEALESISETVRNNIAGAGQVRDAVASAREEGHQGKEILGQTVGAIHRIARMSGEISKTIDVIDDIAFQTNLLALNAGVEAARAGEQGRGFAVIAQEVRALSQRAGESANAIKDVIRRSDEEVKSGVKLVGKSGESFTDLVSKIDDINSLVEAMNALSDEQTQSLMMVRMAVEELDGLAKQNVVVVNRSRVASVETSEQAGALRNLVAKFKLGDEGQAIADNDMAALSAAALAAEDDAGAHAGPCAVQIDDDFFGGPVSAETDSAESSPASEGPCAPQIDDDFFNTSVA